jgi:hypothetical protein
MTMADKKNGKKDKKEGKKPADDLFGEMDDVLGERKEASIKAEETKDKPVEESKEPQEEKKHPTHARLDPRPASQASVAAEKSMIYITNKDGQMFTIDEISPEDFAWWCNDKLPGMRKVKAEQLTTPQHRRDLFEEVIKILEHWFNIGQQKPNRNLY